MLWDYAKAYDSVPTQLVLDGLARIGVPQQFRELYCSWTTGRTARISTGHGPTEQVHIRRGVIQGSVLSSLLYAIAMDPITHALAGTRGYRMHNGTEVHYHLAKVFL